MPVTVYAYDNCSTCKNALKWMDSAKIVYTKIPIVEKPPTLAQLKEFVQKSGLPLKKFFNTSGLVYKEMKLSEKLPSLSDAEQLKLLASNGKLLKRPLVADAKGVLVGFKADEYKEHFKK